ncbi:MAG: MOSC domain-containing protein [Candidatus Aminicenantales bacterium]|jgi:cyclic pyranopterin phosphate synthase
MPFTVETVCSAARKGEPKHAVESVRLVAGSGVEGDAHAGSGHRQVSFLAGEDVDSLRAEGLTLTAGAFGENIVTRGIDWRRARIGGLIEIGAARLEITQIGKECHTPCAIFRAAGRCIMPDLGIFAKVLQGGVIHAGDRGDYRFGPGL